eukprot:367473-Rhodomonas_salina.1
MCEGSMLLEHTLVLGGDVVDEGVVWQGWPGQHVDVASLLLRVGAQARAESEPGCRESGRAAGGLEDATWGDAKGKQALATVLEEGSRVDVDSEPELSDSEQEPLLRAGPQACADDMV